jgi:dTDP-4-dehydrorhamnose reductase
MNKKVLITGCGGMLGKAVYETFSNEYKEVLATDIDLNEPWLESLDVRSMEECEKVFQDFKPEIVIHLAALTDLEYCEKNQENAWRTNALGTENLALLSEKNDCQLVYISTAGIFDGEQEEYTDFDTPNPINIYGKSKYHGELFVEKNTTKHYVLRAGWMMGGGPKKDKKFINKIYKQIKDGAKELFVVEDKLGTPTYTKDFAKGIFKLIQTPYYGVYNQVCSGNGSRRDVAIEFVEQLGLSDEIKVTKVDSEYWKKEFFAPRPRSEKLVNLKLSERNLNVMRDWKECMQEYTREFKEDYNNERV